MISSRGKVLVTGSAGQLGGGLADVLAERGWTVARAARAGTRPDHVSVGEIGPDTDWSAALEGAEAVVHCAALTWLAQGTAAEQEAGFQRVNRLGTAALARQAAKAGVRRFVLISSATVNGRSSGERPFRADDPPKPDSPYSRSKRDAETDLFEIAGSSGMEAVVIRPPRILWPEVSGNLALLAKLIGKGLPLPLGAVTHNRRDNVSPQSLIDLIELALDHPNAASRIFLVSDGDPLSTRELLTRLGRYVGRAPRLLPVPPALVRLCVRLMPQRLLGRIKRPDMELELLGNLELDVSPARELLGWRPSPSAI